MASFRSDGTRSDHEGVCFCNWCVQSFPRFSSLLAATREYAVLSEGRFRIRSFQGSDELDVAAPSSSSSGDWADIVRRAAPRVHEFACRLLDGDEGLHEELGNACRIVMVEYVRNAVLAACRSLDLWPPDPQPAGILSYDCAYEDMSAALDEIAQRAYNDEVRRVRSEAASSTAGLAHRASTAAYLVEFAHEVGVTHASVPETFQLMLTELEMRIVEWGCTIRSESRNSFESNVSLKAAAENVRACASLGAPREDALTHECGGANRSTKHFELIVDRLGVSELFATWPHARDALRPYVEVQIGSRWRRTLVCEFPRKAKVLSFSSERMSFTNPEGDIAIRVRNRDGDVYSSCSDRLFGEAVALMPFRSEQDYRPRKLEVPISCNYERTGVVALRIFLKLPDVAQLAHNGQLGDGTSGDAYNMGHGLVEENRSWHSLQLESQHSQDSVAAGAVLVANAADVRDHAVESAKALAAKVLPVPLGRRQGFGTCARQEASVIIVTEEGASRFFYYPYATRVEADDHFNSWKWKIISRIMYKAVNGIITEEICKAGHSFAHSAIRRAAQGLVDAPSDGDLTLYVVGQG